MSDETKECPTCAETIKIAAKKCKHCGERLEEADSTERISSHSHDEVILLQDEKVKVTSKSVTIGEKVLPVPGITSVEIKATASQTFLALVVGIFGLSFGMAALTGWVLVLGCFGTPTFNFLIFLIFLVGSVGVSVLTWFTFLFARALEKPDTHFLAITSGGSEHSFLAVPSAAKDSLLPISQAIQAAFSGSYSAGEP